MFFRRLASILALAFPALAAAQTASIPPAGGIKFEQITFQFERAQQQNSAWARAVADLELLTRTARMQRGYVNIRTDQGWVVQNWEIDIAETRLRETPSSAPVFYFRLFEGEPRILTGVPAVVEMSRAPLPTFVREPQLIHPVTFHFFNAEGAGRLPTTAIPAPPEPDQVTPAPEGRTFSHILPNLSNVEAAQNQCFPMSVANSLQYLEDRFGLPVPDAHRPGLRGDDTLVGVLDSASGRTASTRAMGDGVWYVPMFEGKFSYLEDEGLEDALIHRHQGVGHGGTGNQFAPGNFTSDGQTSTSNGAAVTWDWMCERIKEGCDIELVYTRHDAAGAIVGAHAVRVYGCGMTLDKPWIKFAHDGTQNNDAFGLETPQVYVEDFDNDGVLNLGGESREIQFAFAECPSPELRNGTFSPPQTFSDAIVHAATYTAGLARSGLATVFGLFNTIVNAPRISVEPGPAQQARVQVLVDGRPAPIFYADGRQINFQVPAETAEGIASVMVVVDGVASDLVTAEVSAVAPGIFLVDEAVAGRGHGAVQNQDFTLNTPSRRAAPGTALIVYASGLGDLNPPVATGQAAPASPLAKVVGSVGVTIGGRPATVAFAGATPGYVGLMQVNVMVPALAPGEHEMVLSVDGVEANRVMVSVGS